MATYLFSGFNCVYVSDRAETCGQFTAIVESSLVMCILFQRVYMVSMLRAVIIVQFEVYKLSRVQFAV